MTIKDAGRIVDGQFGSQKKFLVSTRNGDKRATFNQSTENILVDVFGEDSEDWIGKEVTALTRKAEIAGKKVIILYLVTEGWSLDDYGALVNESQENPEENINYDDIPI